MIAANITVTDLTTKGRGGVKDTLFLAGMSARRSKSHLRAFYERLVALVKEKMVALVAFAPRLS